MRDLLDSPENFYLHAERFGTSILTSTVYGYNEHTCPIRAGSY